MPSKTQKYDIQTVKQNVLGGLERMFIQFT